MSLLSTFISRTAASISKRAFRWSWALAVALFAAAMPSVAEAPVVKDADGKQVKIASSERIVSLNGSVTEILFALGAGGRVVGCDSSSTYPEHVLKTLPSVGYQYQLNAEGILSLKPTLVVGKENVKPPQVIEQLRMAGATVLLLKDPLTFKDAKRRLLTIGKAVGADKKAAEIAKKMDGGLKKLKAKMETRKEKTKPRVLFLYLRGPQTAFVMGKKTAADSMIRAVGAENAADAVKGVKPMTSEAVLAARPDVYLLFIAGLKSIGGVDGLLKLPALAHTPAGKNRRVVSIDGLYFSGFGPHSAEAALDLFQAVHETKGQAVVQRRKTTPLKKKEKEEESSADAPKS